MARGHALSQGRNFITKEDIPVVIKVVLSTASIEKVTIFDLLLAHEGILSTPVIADSLNISSQTALRTMTEFKALGLVDMEDGATGSEHVTEITLKPEFKWFLSPEFQKLREGYKPESNKTNKKNNNEANDEASESIYKIYPGKWGCKHCEATTIFFSILLPFITDQWLFHLLSIKKCVPRGGFFLKRDLLT
jgi:hypothetical protein